jgi:hypothetical protein
MPVIVWGNGGCSNSGTGFYKFLNEIASHGYYVVANCPPSGAREGTSKAKDLPNAIEWVSQNAGKGHFTNMDGSKIAAVGQSCGGTIFRPSRPISTLDMAALISRLKEESLVKPLSISLTGSSKETKLLVSSFWILPRRP